MKALLLLLVVLAGIWLWRNRAASINQHQPKSRAPAPAPEDTVACSHCQVHFPRAEAVQGQRGSYCGLEHLRQAEP